MDTAFDPMLEQFRVYMKDERGLSPYTIIGYMRALRYFSLWAKGKGLSDWQQVTIAHLCEWIRDERQRITYKRKRASRRVGSEVVHQAICALKTFYVFAWDYVKGNPAEALEVPRRGRTLPKPLSQSDIERLLTPRLTPQELMELAMLELAYASGLRLAEIIGVRISDVKLDERIVSVIGKGNKERIIPFGSKAQAAIERYLQQGRPILANLNSPDNLFLNQKGKPLDAVTTWLRLRNRARACGITRAVSPHMLRHSFATHMLDGNADLRVIQEMLGHASIVNTEVYTFVSPQRLVQQFRQFHPRASEPSVAIDESEVRL
jgi:integrase/recombinase XerD